MAAMTPKKLQTGFYFLKDQTGRQTSRPLATAQLVKDASAILAQISIEIMPTSHGYQTIPQDLGNPITFSKTDRTADGRTKANYYYELLYNLRKANPEPFSVFFVWDFLRPEAGPESAFTWVKGRETICIFKDDIPNAGRNLAHEAGHALGIYYDDTMDPSQLMYEYDSPGTKIGTDQVAKMRGSELLQ